jgi:E3 ubiquitin-protein ligase ATL10/75/76/77/78
LGARCDRTFGTPTGTALPLFGAPHWGSGCADDAGAGAEPPVRAFLVPLRPEGFMTPYDF